MRPSAALEARALPELREDSSRARDSFGDWERADEGRDDRVEGSLDVEADLAAVGGSPAASLSGPPALRLSGYAVKVCSHAEHCTGVPLVDS